MLKCKTCNQGPETTKFYDYGRRPTEECKECSSARAYFNIYSKKFPEIVKNWKGETALGFQPWFRKQRLRQKVTDELHRAQRKPPKLDNLLEILFCLKILKPLRSYVLTVQTASAVVILLNKDAIIEEHEQQLKQGKIKSDREYRKRKRQDLKWVAKERKRSRESRKRNGGWAGTVTKRTGPKIKRNLVWQKSEGICGICHEPIEDFNWWHVDHIVPVSGGGTNALRNLQATHVFCNWYRGAKLINEIETKDISRLRYEWESDPHIQEFQENRTLLPCGTAASWHRGCRCKPCKGARNAYERKRKAKYRKAATAQT